MPRMRHHQPLPLDATLSPPVRCHFHHTIDETTERLALRAVLVAARLFGLAAGTHLRQLRNLGDPLA